MQYRINGQYIIEGLTAGFMFVVGALGFILLDKSINSSTSKRNRYSMAFAGVLCVIISYLLCGVFIRIKVDAELCFA